MKKKAVRKKDPNKEIVVITQAGCPACEELKRNVRNVRYMDLSTSSEAVRIADQLGITSIPTVIQMDRVTGKVCRLNSKLRPVKCMVVKKD